MTDFTPFVRVIVINFDGGQMTIGCLQSLLATDWPDDQLEIVMVDNGSLDDVVERVRVELPQVRIVEPLANTGFAAGCNLGIRALDPDAVPDSERLKEIVTDVYGRWGLIPSFW